MYTAVLLHVGDDEWAAEFEASLKDAFRRTLQNDELLQIVDSVEATSTQATDPVVVVYLANSAGAQSAEVARSLERAREEAFAVIPIKQPDDAVESVIPSVIRRLNVVDWDEGSRVTLLMHILRSFGLAESDRKLFLSYFRNEASTVALQLRTQFSLRNYDVFLDRFSVPPGVDFQDRLDRELADKAFVLLIESPSSIESPWVQHEVAYAMSHHIGIYSLVLPGTPESACYEVVDNAFRWPLHSSNLDEHGELRSGPLMEILDHVEIAYARQIRRRRAQLLGSLMDWLFQAGWQTQVVGDWAIYAEKDGGPSEAMFVTPRAPMASDLRFVDHLRAATLAGKGRVVHDTLDRHPDNIALIDWIVTDRPLLATALAEIPLALGLP